MRRYLPKRATYLVPSNCRPKFLCDVRNLSTKTSDENKNDAKPASLLTYGLVSSFAYGSVYLSVLGAIFLAMESNVISPDQLGVDIDVAIQQVIVNFSTVVVVLIL